MAEQVLMHLGCGTTLDLASDWKTARESLQTALMSSRLIAVTDAAGVVRAINPQQVTCLERRPEARRV